MKKFIFINLKIQNGDYEYHSKTVHELTEGITKEEYAEDFASGFYGGDVEREHNGTCYFHGGEVAVKVCSVDDITEKEYNVLNKFL